MYKKCAKDIYDENYHRIGERLTNLNNVTVHNILIKENGNYTFHFKYMREASGNALVDVYLKKEVEEDSQFVNIRTMRFHSTGELESYDQTELGISGMESGEYTLMFVYNDGQVFFLSMRQEIRHETIRSFYLSNWANMMAIWKARKLALKDEKKHAPGIRELRIADNWSENLIRSYYGLFKDKTTDKIYSNAMDMDVEAFFHEDGMLKSDYIKHEDDNYGKLDISRNYYMLPDKNILLIQYQISNMDEYAHDVSIVDILNPENITNNMIAASYKEEYKAFLIKLSLNRYMALGTLQEEGFSFQLGNWGIKDVKDNNCEPEILFKNGCDFKNDSREVESGGMSVAFQQTCRVEANKSKIQNLYFYLAVGKTKDEVQDLCNEMNAKDGNKWVEYEGKIYKSWLDKAKQCEKISQSKDTQDLKKMYQRNLIMIKNSILPGDDDAAGAMPATTNMFAGSYGYKVWSRDAATTMVAMDAAGFTEEGEKFWKWMAKHQVQEEDEHFHGKNDLRNGNPKGAFYTCLNLWDASYADFIEPEHDSIGWFLYGVYRHCLEVGFDKSEEFAKQLWPAILASADLVVNNIQHNKFGPYDFSIWEGMQYFGAYTYTQGLYVAGLQGAAKIARLLGDHDKAISWEGAASSIKTGINKNDAGTQDIGLWNDKGKYYDKLLVKWGDNLQPIRILDASAMIMFVLGVVDVESKRTKTTIKAFEKGLGRNKYGMSRFAEDVYYSDLSPYSPAGDEALGISPSWPQMSCWNAIVKCYEKDKETALEILNWIKERTAVGFMPTGECYSDVSEKPVLSTASEPVTAAAFILACLTWADELDMRIMPEISNAGAYKPIDIEKDAKEYCWLPYYNNVITGVKENRLLRRIYISNDTQNLYLCIDSLLSKEEFQEYQCTIYCSVPTQGGKKISETDRETYNFLVDTGKKELIVQSGHAFVCTEHDAVAYKFNNQWEEKQIPDKILVKCVEHDAENILKVSIPLSQLGIMEVGTGSSDDYWFYIMVYLENKNDTVKENHININYRITKENYDWLSGDLDFEETEEPKHNLSGKDVIYMVLTDRFYNGDPRNDGEKGEEFRPGDLRYRQGGDWKGLREHLDYISDLGATTIWMSPVQKNMVLSKDKEEAGYHGYFIQDFKNVDEHFGDEQELRNLIEEAHGKGMKIVLDAVLNHTGDFLDPFELTYKEGADHPEEPFNKPEWYHHNGTIVDYEDPWQLINCDMGGLDDLAQEKEEVAKELIDSYKTWMDCGFDAIRVDAASSIPGMFLNRFEKEMDVDTFGEIHHGDVRVVSRYQEWQWGVLDFPLYFVIRDVFAKGQGCHRLHEILSEDGRYKNPLNLITFIDNHDRDRFLTVCQNDCVQLHLALAFIFTVRGIPCVYYGTEQRLYGKGKAHGDASIANIYNREMMDKDSIDQIESKSKGTYQFIKKLSDIRKKHVEIQEGAQKELYCTDNIYSFARYIEKTGKAIIVVLNKGKEKTEQLEILLPKEITTNKDRELWNLLDGTKVPIKVIDNQTQCYLNVSIEPGRVAIFSSDKPDNEPGRGLPWYYDGPTTIKVTYDETECEGISLVGSKYPLSWHKTVEMTKVSKDTWEYRFYGLDKGEKMQYVPILRKKVTTRLGNRCSDRIVNVPAKVKAGRFNVENGTYVIGYEGTNNHDNLEFPEYQYNI